MRPLANLQIDLITGEIKMATQEAPAATQEVPAGYYVSNSKDEDVFLVDKDKNFYFKKMVGSTHWMKTDEWNFDHVCDVETVNDAQGISASVDSHDGRGMEIKVTAHVGLTVKDVLKWKYVNPDGNQAQVWGGVDGGVGDGVSMDAGVWYDKDGDLHVKMSTCGVIPHVAFGADIVINPKTVQALGNPTSEDRAFAKGFTEGATFGIASKPPPVLTHTVAAVHKLADDIGHLV